MPTQTPILKPQTYIRPSEQAIGSRELDSVKVIIAAVVLAVLACMAAVGISAAICVYVAPPTEVNQLKT